MNQMSTTLNDEHWLNLITQCRSSGLTDRQWCIENGIPFSTFYYHVRTLRKKPVRFRKQWMLPHRNRKLSRSHSGKRNSIQIP
ncbi:MAG: IS66 family insertion sequence element accessory protein TnpA [Lachnospiraceae bacterium]